MWDIMRSAELIDEATALDAQTCLERSGRVIDSSVNDATVVCARIETGARVTFQDTDGKTAQRYRARRGEADDSCSDNCNIDLLQLGRLQSAWYNFEALTSIAWRNARSSRASPDRTGPTSLSCFLRKGTRCSG